MTPWGVSSVVGSGLKLDLYMVVFCRHTDSQAAPKRGSRPFAMSNYGIVTFPMVAAILYCGVLTTHAAAKAVVGHHSGALLPQQELAQDAATALRLFAQEALLRDDESNVLTSGGSSALSHFLHRLQKSRGSKVERQRMAAMLKELRMRMQGPSSGEEENNAVEEERRPQWDKRLEVLENDGSSMADRRALEARRRMGPEFNPTGW